jgi:hypothetical protein
MAHDKTYDQNDPGRPAVQNMRSLYAPGYSTYFPLQATDAIRGLDYFAYGRVAQLVQIGEVRCFADLLLAWLVYGNAALSCPTYDLYLLTVIRAIGLWVGDDDESEEHMQIEHLPQRVPTDDRRERWSVKGIYVMGTLVRGGSEANLFAHPAFDRATYEMAKVERSLVGWKEERFS